MRKLALAFYLVAFSLFASAGTDSNISEVYDHKASNVQVGGVGVVVKILPDDRNGSRHQRFILSLENSQTILVAHNIDLAPRINGLNVGDKIEFYGEYEWNKKGGTVHWTHRDPSGRHVGGWLMHNGRRYE